MQPVRPRHRYVNSVQRKLFLIQNCAWWPNLVGFTSGVSSILSATHFCVETGFSIAV